jgi:hypothetical protein
VRIRQRCRRREHRGGVVPWSHVDRRRISSSQGLGVELHTSDAACSRPSGRVTRTSPWCRSSTGPWPAGLAHRTSRPTDTKTLAVHCTGLTPAPWCPARPGRGPSAGGGRPGWTARGWRRGCRSPRPTGQSPGPSLAGSWHGTMLCTPRPHPGAPGQPGSRGSATETPGLGMRSPPCGVAARSRGPLRRHAHTARRQGCSAAARSGTKGPVAARRARVGIASSGSASNGSAMGETSLGGCHETAASRCRRCCRSSSRTARSRSRRGQHRNDPAEL